MDIVKQDAEEKALNARASELYQQYEREWHPMFPWVIVRVLKKSHRTDAGLFLPEVQNKTIHEGIVLAVWSPMVMAKLGKLVDADRVALNPDAVYYESSLKIGDHVLFPHWAGLPLPGVPDTHYRMVKEEGWDTSKEGGIFSTVHLAEQDLVSDKLYDIIFGVGVDINIREAIQKITDEFILVPRGKQSVTMSGV